MTRIMTLTTYESLPSPFRSTITSIRDIERGALQNPNVLKTLIEVHMRNLFQALELTLALFPYS